MTEIKVTKKIRLNQIIKPAAYMKFSRNILPLSWRTVHVIDIVS